MTAALALIYVALLLVAMHLADRYLARREAERQELLRYQRDIFANLDCQLARRTVLDAMCALYDRDRMERGY